MWIYFQISLLGLALADQITQECEKLYLENDPRLCCDVPFLLGSSELLTTCQARCENKQAEDSCCALDCLLEVSGLFVDGEVNKDKIPEVSKATASRYGSAYKKWIPVISNSDKVCQTMLVKAWNGSLPPSTCEAMTLIPFFNCYHQQNFLNCPNFNNSQSCEAVKHFVESQDQCGISDGETFILDGLFWRYLNPVQTI